MSILKLKQGTTPTIPVTFPFTIVGMTLYVTAKNGVGDPDTGGQFTKKVTSHIDAANGKTSFTLTAADTANAGNYLCDLRLIDGSGNIANTQNFNVLIEPSITQRTS